MEQSEQSGEIDLDERQDLQPHRRRRSLPPLQGLSSCYKLIIACTMAKYEVYKPTEGYSVEAAQTMRRSESQNAFRKRLGIDTSTQIRLVRVSHMVYQHSDIESIVVFLHGESSRPHFPPRIGSEDGGGGQIRLSGRKADPN